jgi:glycosyltransferase involved in cell wall biosynthesis
MAFRSQEMNPENIAGASAPSGHHAKTKPVRSVANAQWDAARPRLSVLIPSYHDDASALIRALASLDGADSIEILIHDDGARNRHIAQNMGEAVLAVTCPALLALDDVNRGRAGARNALLKQARADWLLLLDADMLPDDPGFLRRYLDAIDQTKGEPAMIVGGFSMLQAPDDKRFKLHRAQSQVSDCLPASVRQSDPGRFVFTSNVLVHRAIFEEVPFDESFTGWGWEDVDWGWRTAARFPVRHIDNTATHLGLEEARVLIRKFTRSGENFARLADKHEATRATPLYRWAERSRGWPLRTSVGFACRWIAADPLGILPVRIRMFGLKLARAVAYGGHLT